MAALRSKIRKYQTKQKKSSQRELREPWVIDGDLAEEADALTARREAVVAQYARKRRELAGDDDGDGPEFFAGPDFSEIDAAEAAALEPIDAEIAELRALADEQTVYLVFRPVSSPVYDELFHRASSESAKGAVKSVEALLCGYLASACFVGTEVDGELDRSETWDELKALTDDDSDDFGAPLMTPGFVDYIETLVLALNRRVPARPFS